MYVYVLATCNYNAMGAGIDTDMKNDMHTYLSLHYITLHYFALHYITLITLSYSINTNVYGCIYV